VVVTSRRAAGASHPGCARMRALRPMPYPEILLCSVKAQYDPTNLFRLNQNMPPAGAGS